MKILVTGGKGMLGRTLQRRLAEHEIVVADLPDWDITDDAAFTEKTVASAPDVIVHCAAMTKVDACETDRDLAFRLNEEGSRNVALAAKACGARLIAISTDYVFSGEPPHEPWAWGEQDIPAPRTVYGASKFAGEQMIQMILPEAVILRIAWLYGSGGPSFVHTMAKLGAQEGSPLKVVDDQRGNPTSTDAVADVIRFLLTKPDVSGIVHGTCEGQCTWYDLTVELFRLLGLNRAVEPCTTEEFPRPAPRPHNSALRKSVLNVLGYRTPTWQKALADFVAYEWPEASAKASPSGVRTLYLERSTGASRDGRWTREIDLSERPTRIVVGTGPGSFAGIRAALAFAQGYALGSGCEVLGVPSPCALADGSRLAVVGDARRGKIWIALLDGYRLARDVFQVEAAALAAAVPADYAVVSPDDARIGALLAATFGARYRGEAVPTDAGLRRFAEANPAALRPEPLPIYLNPAVRD